MEDFSNSISEEYQHPTLPNPLHPFRSRLSQDFITSERGRTFAITYVDHNVTKTVLTTETHIIDIPVEPDSSTPVRRFSRPNDTGLLEQKMVPIEIKIAPLKPQLDQTIQDRFHRKIRQDYTTQLRVNRRMLEGFEGFHGELARLWDHRKQEKYEELVSIKIADDRTNLKREGGRNRSGHDSVDKEIPRLGLADVDGIEVPQLEDGTVEGIGSAVVEGEVSAPHGMTPFEKAVGAEALLMEMEMPRGTERVDSIEATTESNFNLENSSEKLKTAEIEQPVQFTPESPVRTPEEVSAEVNESPVEATEEAEVRLGSISEANASAQQNSTDAAMGKEEAARPIDQTTQ
jgi:hypothetical protein